MSKSNPAVVSALIELGMDLMGVDHVVIHHKAALDGWWTHDEPVTEADREEALRLIREHGIDAQLYVGR